MIENAVFNRIQRIASELPHLPKELTMRPWNMDAPYSELNWRNYENRQGILGAFKESVIPEANMRTNIRAGFVLPDSDYQENDAESWLFVNGMSGSKDILNLNGLALANLFAKKVHLILNASEGIIGTVTGNIAGKLSTRSEKVAASLCKILENELRKKEKVVLIAHSLGAQISASAIERLTSRLEKQTKGLTLLSKLEFYTFASTNININIPEHVHTEHFLNKGDKLAAPVRIDISEAAPIFVNKRGQGHLLNAHYLPYFLEGCYESRAGKESWLFNYLPF